MKTLDKLKNIDFNTNNEANIRILLEDIPIAVISYELPKGMFIVRSRKGGNFTKRSEMTYSPAKYATSPQRASLKGQSVFYGVVSDNQAQQENARVISVSECSKLCRQGKKSIGQESFSVSFWEIVKPICVASLITDTTFPDVQDNRLLNQLRNDFIQAANKQDMTNETKELAYFINSEFSKVVKDSKEYLISATIAHDIINDMEFDGIIFPSVQLGGQAGLNIAISPKVVNKKLRFVRILKQTLYKNGAKSIVRIEKVTERGKKTKSIVRVHNNIIEKELGIRNINDLKIK